MKSLSNLLHKTPWWALAFGALAVFGAIGVFVTPYHIIQYRDDGTTPEQSRAIKREIDNTFAENAINIGRGVIQGMLARTTDPDRRAELEQALEGLEEARTELRDAGAEVLRAKREALDHARDAARAAQEAVRNVRREMERALAQAGPEHQALRKQFEESLKAAEAAEREAALAVEDARGTRIGVGIGTKKGKDSLIDITIDPPVSPAKPSVPVAPVAPGKPAPPALPGKPAAPALPVKPGAPATPAAPAAPSADAVAGIQGPPSPLPPEVRTKIRRDVTGDMYRIGIGAALIVILLPLLILAIVTKFFVDRSRAATRLADLKRKEAEYHRMGQQVTEAKLAALQAQVEPHFLYNTLASVQALTEVDPAKANAMTGHLIQYLRNALPKMRESVSTVGQEIELVRAYLSILQMRMGSRLAFDIDVAPHVAALPFPPLMLPSLVENAIKHGLEPQREGGRVDIRAELDGGKLRVIVADTGRGFGDTVGAGVGLVNIRERLAALYGDAARLTLVANAPQGVVSTIEVPAIGTGSAAGARAPEAAATATAFAAAPQAAKSSESLDRSLPEGATTVAPAGKLGFWASLWNGAKVAERIWRKALYYLYLALVAVAGIAALAGIIAVIAGLAPVQMDDTVLGGPGGVLVGIAGMLIGFVAVVVAAAVVIAIFYGLGYLMFAVAIVAILALLLGLSPVIAPFVLLILFIWWMASGRHKGIKPTRPAASGANRTEPRFDPMRSEAAYPDPAAAPAVPPEVPPPIPSAEPGR